MMVGKGKSEGWRMRAGKGRSGGWRMRAGKGRIEAVKINYQLSKRFSLTVI